MSHSDTRPKHSSRGGRFPSPRISYIIGVTELRRVARKTKQQDIWLLLTGIAAIVLMMVLPMIYGYGRDFGEALAGGDTGSVSSLVTLVVVYWLGMAALGLVSGVGSEGELDNQAALLAMRPPKDIAGGMLVGVIAGYSPFVILPVLAGAIGLSVGVGSLVPLVGILIAALLLLVSAVTFGYGTGLWLKGVIRRSTWLTAAKPVLVVGVIVGYIWGVFTGRLWPVATEIGTVLTSTPLGWFSDLALATTPNAEAGAVNAPGIIILTAIFLPIGVLAVVRGGEYVWYVDHARPTRDDGEERPSVRRPLSQQLDGVFETLRVGPATRGVAITVLIRGYRSPLQLVYVVVPFVFLIPMLDPMIRSGVVPDWMPWIVLLYGGWAAGAGFPLNALGNQGGMLPTVLTSVARGKHVVHGTVVASLVVFAPLTVALSVGTGYLADRAVPILVAVGLTAVLAVIAGSILAAGIGATFPRFTGIDLTDSTSVVLPSKMAFGLFSMASVLAATSVSILADELYLIMMSEILSEHLPFGLVIGESALEGSAIIISIVVVLALPLAYFHGCRRINEYHID